METRPEAIAEDAGVVGGEDADRHAGEPGTGAGGRGVRERGMGTGNGAGSRATQFKPKHPQPVVAKSRRADPGKGARKPCRLLRDMRWVYGHDEEWDRPYGHAHCRRWLEQDLKGFLSKLGQLEAALGSAR